MCFECVWGGVYLKGMLFCWFLYQETSPADNLVSSAKCVHRAAEYRETWEGYQMHDQSCCF